MIILADIEFNEFLKNNALYLALGAAGLIAIVLLAILLPRLLKKDKKDEKKAAKKKPIDRTVYITALGGEENIVSHELVRSRIVLHLNDYSKVDKEKLKEAGVDGFILMSDKLTLVIQGDADKVNRVLFGEE